MYIGDYLEKRCVYSPDGEAIIDLGIKSQNRFTFQKMNKRAKRLANWLKDFGIEKGDRVGMIALDGIHFYDSFFACGKLGAILVPFNWRLHPKEIHGLIQQTSPKVLFYSTEAEPKNIADYLTDQKDVQRLIPLTGNENSFHQFVHQGNEDSVTCESLTENDTAVLLFTGGTTGLPKAAQITHKQVVWNTMNNMLADILGTDKYLNVFPLFHAGGLFAFTIPMLILGGTIVQTKSFDPETVLNTIEDENISIFAGVPSMFQRLATAKNWEDADLSTLRYCMSGGAPMPVPLIQKYQKEKQVVFRQGFGLTEFGPSVFSLSVKDSVRKAGSVGKPNFFVDVKIVNIETKEQVLPHETGELLLRGPSAMSGYYKNPDATSDAFEDDGFFHTGDLAYVDDEGYYFIVDRLKDMFISGGENVFPAEIEKVLYAHESISMCSVIGVKDEKWGDVGKAFITLKPGRNNDENDILQYLKDNLAKYKVPKSVEILDEMPISGAGKILKTELRKMVS